MPKQKQTTHLPSSLFVALFAMAGGVGSVAADVTKDIEDALNFYHYGQKGAIKFDLNTRWENVNQDKGPTNPKTHLPVQTANAFSSRLRLGYLTPVWQGLQGYAEYEGNLVMDDSYNNTRGYNTAYSAVADPSVSEFNQFWLAYTGIADNIVKAGRQRIKLDDDRFIGNVGWRQMEQTYDSILITHKNQTLFGLVANVGYISNVQTFLGTTDNIQAPLVNLNYKIGDVGNVVGYGYWLDYTEKANYEKSSQTYGLRFVCCDKPLASYKISDNFGLAYTAEYSHQSDYGHGVTRYDADRYNLMGGLSAYGVMFQGAMEQLGGSGLNKTFDTPLGTNHAFQGWADLFLVTPNNGIRDVFGTIMMPFQRGDLVFTTVYHDYSDDTGRFNFGNEWDFQAVQKFGKHYSVLLKYADYNAGDNNPKGGFTSTDTQKFWVQTNINFFRVAGRSKLFR